LSVYLFYNFRDFDPAETVREKMMKIGDVKGVRGLRKLMKEIAITASTGKHDNELVGSVALPLKVRDYVINFMRIFQWRRVMVHL
jgi:hypothetical protein